MYSKTSVKEGIIGKQQKAFCWGIKIGTSPFSYQKKLFFSPDLKVCFQSGFRARSWSLKWLSKSSSFSLSWLPVQPALAASCPFLLPLHSAFCALEPAMSLASISSCSTTDTVTELTLLPCVCLFSHHHLLRRLVSDINIHFPKTWPSLTTAPSTMKITGVFFSWDWQRVAVHAFHTSSCAVIQCLQPSKIYSLIFSVTKFEGMFGRINNMSSIVGHHGQFLCPVQSQDCLSM